MSMSRLSRSPYLLIIIVLALLAGCSSSSDDANVETATLVVRTTNYPGNMDYAYVLETQESITAATVHRRYNAPTGDEEFEGDLAAIYEAVTGSPPETPSDYRTADEILEILADHGWEIVDESVIGDALVSSRTIKLQRPLSSQS